MVLSQLEEFVGYNSRDIDVAAIQRGFLRTPFDIKTLHLPSKTFAARDLGKLFKCSTAYES